MKKTLQFLLFCSITLCTLNSQAQVNVGTGNLTGQSLPIEPYFGFTYSQSIYLASEINASGSVTGITFFSDAGTTIANSNDWVVYLGHTTKTSFASNTDWETGLTQKFAGIVTIVADQVTITFTTPFVYNGTDNLIVAVDENAASYDGNSDEFLCSSVGTDRSLTYRNDTNNPDPTGILPTASIVGQAIPNIQFIGISQSCPTPSVLTSTNITDNSANIAWTENGTANTWNIEYGTTGFTPTGTPTIAGTMNNPESISGLSGNTGYDVYIQADCGSETSAWVGPLNFTTECGAYTPTYSQDFTTFLPTCWGEAKGILTASSVLTGTSSSWTSDGFANSGSTGAARMNIYAANQNEWLISPSIDLTGGPFQLKYNVALTTYSGTGTTTMDADDSLVVVISTDNGATWSDANILTVYTSGSEPSNTGDLEIIDLTAYTGTIKIGFYAYSSQNLAVDNSIFIDNFAVEPIPACSQVSGISASNTTATTLDLAWTENGSAGTWNIEFGTTGFTPTGTPTIVGTTNNPEGITGLSANTSYDFYVQADCGGSGTSSWTGPFTVTTPCGVYIPTYIQDFTTYTPECWEEAKGILTTSSVLTGTSSSWSSDGFANSGSTGAARMNIYSTNQNEWLISPSIDLTGGPFQLKYDVALTTYSGTGTTTMDADDSLAVVISTDNGATWSDANILTVYTSGSEPSNTGDLEIIDLTAYTGTIKIGFYAYSSQNLAVDNNIFIDNFAVEPIPACSQVSGISASNITGTTLDLAWTENGSAGTWNIEFGTTGFTPTGTPTIVGTIYNPEGITGLSANTAYDFYVQADCGGSGTSTWTGPFTVTTPCGIYTPDYAQDFATYTPECWEEAKGFLTPSTVLTPGSSAWFADGYGNVGTTGAARMNVYSTNQNEWLISPSIDLTGGPFQLEYDVILTAYASSAATTMDADDSLAVVISTDNGATWSNTNILTAYTSGSEPSNTGERAYIDLSTYSGTVKFGFYATSTQNLTVDNDIFIDNFLVTDLCLPTYGTDTQVACDTYDWIDGNTYTSSNNTATFTLANAVGCDSIVTLDLTINNSTTGADVQTVCGPFTWIDGNTYAANNNTATFVVSNAAGCDSTVTLDLTINSPSTGIDTQTACGSLTWIDGNTYTTSNNAATFTLPNAAGCDSVVTLDLIINPIGTSTDVQVACGSYTWIDGNTYSASSNTATFTVAGGSANGCDSIVTLDLTINNPSTGTDVQTACDTYTWIDGNTYSASNNTATFTVAGGSANGCDSIVTLDLTINTVDVTVTIYDPSITANATGASYIWFDCDNNTPISGGTGQSFTATVNGNYAVEVTQNGCIDTSVCTQIVTVSLDNLSLFAGVSVYPNPVKNVVNVNMGSLTNATVKLYDLNGKLLFSDDHVENGIYSFEMNKESGVYFVEVRSEESVKQFKLIKE
ncbi:MAG: T9SS type A sorting domain-containing protein [Crocinitomicaceae bacterium]|nr:T9SS type A sorting domain-containing protein [Flavobacteriales bacterium]NQZ37687.1 T9SS type A sorting domain-containing protein [Crocinitomicaceae bacterium]